MHPLTFPIFAFSFPTFARPAQPQAHHTGTIVSTMDTGEKPTMSTNDNYNSSAASAYSSSGIFSLPNFNLSSLVPQPFRDWHQSLNDWRDRLGLTSPGTSEGLHKEVQRDVFLTNYMFSGMKADLGRSFSANPLFQVQHSFSAGSSQAAPWSFLSLYATDNVPLFLILRINSRFSCKAV